MCLSTEPNRALKKENEILKITGKEWQAKKIMDLSERETIEVNR